MVRNSWITAIAVVVGAAIIAAGLVYALGRPGLDRAAVERIVDEKLTGEAFQERVHDGIVAFIEAQKRERQGRQQADARNLKPPQPSDHVRGDPDARITLIEYSDYECPYCKRFHATAKELVESSGGQVNWIYRHFPLSMHNPGALKQAQAAECAAKQGGASAFWAYSDAIFARTRSNGNGFPVDNLVPLAGEQGLDKAAFQACLENDATLDRVKRDLEQGAEAGVTGTPGNFLMDNATGRVVVVSGARPLEDLRGTVQDMLEQPSE